jgi:hypothetical protein
MPIDPEKLRVGDVFTIRREGFMDVNRTVVFLNQNFVVYQHEEYVDCLPVKAGEYFSKIWESAHFVKLADEPKQSPKPSQIPPEPVTPPSQRNGKFLVYLRAGLFRLVEAKTVTINGGFFVFKDDSGESRHCFAVSDTSFVERIEPADLDSSPPDDDFDDTTPETIKFPA